jgi:predicted transcriptional regulator
MSDSVLTIRVPRELSLRLNREARRQRRSRSAVARDLLAESLGANPRDLAVEARRQSLLVKRRKSERDALAFIVGAADIDGWR